MHNYLSMFYFAVAVSQNRRIVKVWKGAQNMAKKFKDTTIMELITYCKNCTDCKKCKIKNLIAPSTRISTCRILALWAGTAALNEEIDL